MILIGVAGVAFNVLFRPTYVNDVRRDRAPATPKPRRRSAASSADRARSAGGSFRWMSDTTGGASSGWAGGIAAITLFVDDLEPAKRFYERAFGMPVVFEDPDSAVFRFGATLVNLLATSAAPELIGPAQVAPRDAGSRTVFTLHVVDVDALVADLEAGGVTMINGPIDRPWGPRTASFSDPDGHIWEIAQ